MNHHDSSTEAGRRQRHTSSPGPFNNENNIFMFFGGGERSAIVENIIASLRTDNKIIQVGGERGSGKTMLSLVMNDRLKHCSNVIRYDMPEVSPALLLRHLLIELCPRDADLISAEMAQQGVDITTTEAALHCLVKQLLASESQFPNKAFVLIMDSPAELDDESMRILQRLSSLRTNKQAIMRCIVFHRASGQQPDPASSDQQLSPFSDQYWLRRLTLSEINEYLHHHMMLFDFNRRHLFTREMAYFVADRTDGVFRSINTLVANAFTIANLENAESLSMSHLLMAGLPQRPEPSTESGFLVKHRGGLIALLGTCVVASTAAAVFLLT